METYHPFGPRIPNTTGLVTASTNDYTVAEIARKDCVAAAPSKCSTQRTSRRVPYFYRGIHATCGYKVRTRPIVS
jgi:hypothetical protein